MRRYCHTTKNVHATTLEKKKREEQKNQTSNTAYPFQLINKMIKINMLLITSSLTHPLRNSRTYPSTHTQPIDENEEHLI